MGQVLGDLRGRKNYPLWACLCTVEKTFGNNKLQKKNKNIQWFSNFLKVKSYIYFFISECQNYVSLNSYTRKITYSGNKLYCDSEIGPGWFRFEGSGGTRMATSCPPKERCGAWVPGWLNGGHPTVADGRVSRQVCFHWYSNCCYFSRNVEVRNCGSYYVYYLSGTPNGYCHHRYCGTD